MFRNSDTNVGSLKLTRTIPVLPRHPDQPVAGGGSGNLTDGLTRTAAFSTAAFDGFGFTAGLPTRAGTSGSGSDPLLAR